MPFRRPWAAIGFATALAALALALQYALNPLVAPDTYQVFLGAVALSVMYGGTRSGLLTLALCGLSKFHFFMLPAFSGKARPHVLAARMILFLALGLVICWIGGRARAALARVKLLSGLLPICASCKKIRDDAGHWAPLESYITNHSEAEFSHGLCPECVKKFA